MFWLYVLLGYFIFSFLADIAYTGYVVARGEVVERHGPGFYISSAIVDFLLIIILLLAMR